jgi:hypothetical protein
MLTVDQSAAPLGGKLTVRRAAFLHELTHNSLVRFEAAAGFTWLSLPWDLSTTAGSKKVLQL